MHSTGTVYISSRNRMKKTNGDIVTKAFHEKPLKKKSFFCFALIKYSSNFVSVPFAGVCVLVSVFSVAVLFTQNEK